MKANLCKLWFSWIIPKSRDDKAQAVQGGHLPHVFKARPSSKQEGAQGTLSHAKEKRMREL